MKNGMKNLQKPETIGTGQRMVILFRMVLSVLLVMLFSLENVGETAEQAPMTIPATSDQGEHATIEITRKMIEDMVMDFLNEKIPWEKNRVKRKFVQSGNGIMLPNRPYSYKEKPPVKSSYTGMVPMSIVFDVYGQSSRKVSAIVKIEVETNVIVVQKPLNRNQTIEKDDVTVVTMDMADLPSNYISSLEGVVGKRTLRAMNPKEVFRTDMIEQPLMVKRNDKVSIVAESETIRITAVGEVRESGGKGDRIRVVNLNSNKEIFARVLDPKTVRVEF
jgi:flagella basal body P-ring formation protein FlgA